MISIRTNTKGVIFKVFVQPRSSKSMIAGLRGDALKIKLTAPPVDNAANQMCIKFFANTLGISKSSIEIVAGHTSRNKQVLLRSDQGSLAKNDYRRLIQRIEKLVPPKTI